MSTLRRPRVLLADDHLMVAEALTSLLSPEFDLVGVVEDGRQLVEAAGRLRPDVIVADITMSTDNVLAVAGASHGNPFLLLFGLALSIPFVVFTSNLLSMLMDRYPIIIYIGAAVLGKVAGEMIFTDPAVMGWLALPKWVVYCMEALFAVGVIVVGKLWIRFVFRQDREVDVSAVRPDKE